jgi:hypothetical protein
MSSRALLLLATCIACALPSATAGAAYTDFDFESVGAESTTPQAGDHPDVTISFQLNGNPAEPDGQGQLRPWGNLRDLAVQLPPGLTGNPEAFPKCRTDAFMNALFEIIQTGAGGCPVASQVGITKTRVYELGPAGGLREPVYNLESPGGDTVARLGFWAILFPVLIDVKVDPERANALTAEVVHAPAISTALTGSDTTLWGVPTSSAHDTERFNPVEAFICGGQCGGPVSSGLAPTAFMSNPTNCGPQGVDFAATNYPLPQRVVTESASLPDTEGCPSVPFVPAISLRPTTRRADSPSGMEVDLSIPQQGLLAPNLLTSAHLRKAVVTLPQGMALNPAAADGLGGCSEAEIGLVSSSPVRFNDAEPQCPSSSKVGTAKIVTPVLADPLEGSLYVARQRQNPFGSFLAGYMVAKGKGVTIKLAGRFDLDPRTGQITATFDENPQQPFSDLQLRFKGGTRGVLATPRGCGTYGVHTELTPWSGTPPVATDSPVAISEGCASGFVPSLNAGTTEPLAGAFSPFAATVKREDGEQNLAAVDLTLPRGLLAKLAGVPLCPSAQATAGSCPPRSRVGSLDVAVGAGSPLWLPQPGRAGTAVYLAGKYRSSPYSLVFEVPAQAGPFDLGTVRVRAGIDVDPETAQVTVASDPFPQVLEGVPIGYRAVQVEIDRRNFTLNPTSCRTMSVRSRISSSQGALARPRSRVEVGGCRALGFKPRLGIRLFGKTRRGGHPRLRATLTARKGDANLGRAVVSLPRAEFLDQAHIRTVCTRVQFAADACPAGSVYGRARAVTPLLDEPLRGPVYLRSSDNELPDLVAALRGPASEPIEIDLVGRIDSVRGGMRTTFAAVPDAAVSKFVLEMKGGAKGLLVNSRNLCAAPVRAQVTMVAQNGRERQLAPLLRSSCRKRGG